MAVASDGHTWILIECGFPVKDVKRLTGYSPGDYDACLLTHEHMDHAKGARELHRRGMAVYSTHGTREALGGACGVGVAYREQVRIGSFTVMAMPVSHDAAMPCAWFLKSNVTGGTAVYITDACAIPFVVKGVHEVCVECNYSEDMMGDTPSALADRIRASHMSVDGLEEWLRQCDLRSTRLIQLIHISRQRGDPKAFADRIFKKTHIITTAGDYFAV